jgi:hypothetical protein
VATGNLVAVISGTAARRSLPAALRPVVRVLRGAGEVASSPQPGVAPAARQVAVASRVAAAPASLSPEAAVAAALQRAGALASSRQVAVRLASPPRAAAKAAESVAAMAATFAD